jgi:hypothetical protein
MAILSSGPVAVSKTGSNNRNKPRPAMPGGEVFFQMRRRKNYSYVGLGNLLVVQ